MNDISLRVRKDVDVASKTVVTAAVNGSAVKGRSMNVQHWRWWSINVRVREPASEIYAAHTQHPHLNVDHTSAGLSRSHEEGSIVLHHGRE